MVLYLGIDGGGTGCRAAIADAGGRILGQGTGGPANINSDPEGAVVSILAAATGAMVQADATPAQVIAVLGLAGGNMTEAARRTEASLPFARCRVLNDAVIAARGAIGDGDGILVAIGTGSIFAVQRGGALRLHGGRGFLLGDEGSGAVLGRTLLSEAMRAGDGFAPDSPLLRDLRETMGGFEGIIAFGNRAAPAEFAQLARRLVEERDDPAAMRIMEAAARAGGPRGRGAAGHGRSARHLHGGLGPFYAQVLERRWTVAPAQGSATDGAIAIARELGVPA